MINTIYTKVEGVCFKLTKHSSKNWIIHPLDGYGREVGLKYYLAGSRRMGKQKAREYFTSLHS